MNTQFVYGADPRPVPTVESVEAGPGHTLTVTWKDGGTVQIDLSGWISLHDIAELRDEAVFSKPEIGEEADTVQWNSDEHLSIDTVHLEVLAEQQAACTAEDLSPSRCGSPALP